MIKALKKSIQRATPKFIYINQFFGQKQFVLLDAGSGNHSASKTKSLFPNCIYHGIDLQKDFNNDESDYRAMDAFYEMDLTKLEYDLIPDNHYDFIRMAHIIEHLYNGDEVIENLSPKLKSGGYIYIEYPGKKSTTLPSMHGTLNFHDDPTHVRLYSVPELENVLRNRGFEIIKSGTRRNILFLSSTPLRAALSLIKTRKLRGDIFWDLLGFAEFVIARKH